MEANWLNRRRLVDTCGTVISSFFTDLQKWRERADVLFVSSASLFYLELDLDSLETLELWILFITLHLNNVSVNSESF